MCTGKGFQVCYMIELGIKCKIVDNKKRTLGKGSH